MRAAAFCLLALGLLALTGCADHVAIQIKDPLETVGFWHGCWHGFILPVALLWSLLSDDVAIYAVYNNGFWYDLGFGLGLFALANSRISIQFSRHLRLSLGRKP
jgi:hypothetical protein